VWGTDHQSQIDQIAEETGLAQKIQELRTQRNVGGKSADEKAMAEAREKGKKIKEELKKLEEEERLVQKEFINLLLTVPNVPHPDVPIGKDESGNVEIRKWGTPKKFDFKPLDHIELIKRHDLADLERGGKVGGFRAYFLKNEGALLEMAILFYTFQKLAQRGYTATIAPSLVKEFTLFGNGQFPWGREEVYHLEKDDMYLAGTAEVPVTAYYSDETLIEKDLPKKFVAYSPCFRREAGSYGKDTKGLYRLHQFNKVEQVIIGSGATSLAVFEEGELLHVAALPVGGGHITNDIAIGLRTSIEVAEAVKLSYGHALPGAIDRREEIDLSKFDTNEDGAVSRHHIAEIIEARLEEIFQFVNEELQKIGKDGLLPGGVILSGGTALLPGAIELGKDVLRLPMHVGYPAPLGGVFDQVDAPDFSVAVGALLLARDHGKGSVQASKSGMIDFLPKRMVEWWKKAKRMSDRFLP
jgi:hypothetical protein